MKVKQTYVKKQRERNNMDLVGKYIGGRYELLEKIGNRWNGNCI